MPITFSTLRRPWCRAGRELLSLAVPDSAVLAPAVDLELKGNCAKRPTRQGFTV